MSKLMSIVLLPTPFAAAHMPEPADCARTIAHLSAFPHHADARKPPRRAGARMQLRSIRIVKQK